MRLNIAGIRNNWLRRAAMCAAFPPLLAWKYAPCLVLVPVAYACQVGAALAETTRELRQSARYDARLLKAAWLMMWREPCG